ENFTKDFTVDAGETIEYSFTVTYTDDFGLDVTSLNVNNITIDSPAGDLVPSEIEIENNGDATTVTYTIEAPGDEWDVADSGTYTVFLEGDSVRDVSDNFAPAKQLGAFEVNVVAINEEADFSDADEGVIVRLANNSAYLTEYGIDPKIMPLGDSITHGQTRKDVKKGGSETDAERVGYRLPLWEDLNAFGFQPDFVGSQNHGTNNLPDKDHEGHRGKGVGGIFNGIKANPGWIDTAQPDVVLLMIGTNNSGGDPNNTAADLEKLIDRIVFNEPFEGDLLVSSIPLIHPDSFLAGNQGNVDAYNGKIPGIVNKGKYNGEQVSFVDIGGKLDKNDLTGTGDDNGLHPNAQGYETIADEWYKEILQQIGTEEKLANDVDAVTGSDFADVIIGDGEDNTFTGGEGADELTGGGGADSFVYNAPGEGGDTITDFGAGDRFVISALGFGLVAEKAVNFKVGAPENGEATFVYNNGVLSFDADGTGGGNDVDLATLTGKPALNANQFTVIV
ncbi:MAG: GDSL-type esterase/lipase family protein, partial [Cyanobacteriota bacterium]|nr:GDSL-type esterase/lipase family protein [Cyanobacteriota bacterium]